MYPFPRIPHDGGGVPDKATVSGSAPANRQHNEVPERGIPLRSQVRPITLRGGTIDENHIKGPPDLSRPPSPRCLTAITHFIAFLQRGSRDVPEQPGRSSWVIRRQLVIPVCAPCCVPSGLLARRLRGCGPLSFFFCVFHAMPVSDSTGSRSSIPWHPGHSFHAMPVSDSTPSRSLLTGS